MAEEGQEPIKSPGSLLADSLYNPPEPKSEPSTPEGDPSPDPQKVEGSDPVEGGEPEGGDPGEGGEVEEIELSSLEELAEHYELEPEALTKLNVTRKINGKPVTVSIYDAFETYDKVAAADEYLADAKEKAKAIQAEASQQNEQLTTTIATFSKLLENVEAEIDRDVKAINWTKLREDDEVAYLTKKDEVRERRDRLEAMKKEAKETVGQSLASHQKNTEEAIWEDRKKRAPKEKEILFRELPEWESDQERAKAEQEKAIAYMQQLGANENQIVDTLYRGAALSTIVKAMRYDEGKAKAATAKKKVVKVPKVLKPGPSKDAPKANGKDKDDKVSILYG